MHPEFQQLMRQATLLTRSGKLAAATAAIKAALRGHVSDAYPRDEPDVIDVEAREIPASRAASSVTSPAPSSMTSPATSQAARDADDYVSPARKPAVGTDVFIAGSFHNSAGRRDYKLYVPPTAGGQPLPLVVMLHGCTQDADDFAAGTAMNDAARTQGFYVLYPVQSHKANPQKCWNWFKHNHQQEGRGEPSILAGMTREVIGAHAVDPGRVYVAGLSAGGAMAAILAGLYPDLYAAAGVHSGLAPGAASDLPSALSAMKGAQIRAPRRTGNGIPTIVFHGDRDATVHPGNAESVIAASAGTDARVDSVRMSGKDNKRASTLHTYRNTAGEVIAERWEIHGAGHAWAGGTERGSYTDRAGPDATAEMLRFFFQRTLPSKS